ncbi:MAG: bifunctional 4-hydroxy-2-oxoglutarate aldolase/2-dehydro-3-deoxy-phosphogluconate aldolase [Isosphaeraceae bacterium]
MHKNDLIQMMCASGVLPVFRTSDVRHLLTASLAFRDAGIACVEYTMTMPDALKLVQRTTATFPDDFLVGAGTVLDGETAEQAIYAGARFLASPGCEPDVIDACKQHDVPSVVGAITPTEIMTALKLGADVIKVFPATSVGPGFFSEVLGPFPDTVLMAAGGMSLDNLALYVTAGARVVTLLANGLDAAAYASGDGPAITRAARAWVEAVRAARRREAPVPA